MTPFERLGFLGAKLRMPLPRGMAFNMGIWRGQFSECGTAACAFGYASMLPELAADGLEYTPGHDPCIRYGDLRSYRAAAAFFGISGRDAMHLFHPDMYEVPVSTITPAMVADRIDQVVARIATETA